MLREINLDSIQLKSGGHSSIKDGGCVMEWVAFVAGRDHTDHPPCVSPIIGEFLRSWNDAMSDDDRQMLKPLIPHVINTVSTPGMELLRSYMALDWYCRVSTPAWLRLAGLTSEAEAIEATAPIVDRVTAAAAQEALNKARNAASAAGSAARSAAGSAAGSAAWSAAWSAAGSAARSAAGSAAGSAAWSAAWSAAGSAAESAAGSAAGSAARDKLRPTVEMLQKSALELIERMILVDVAIRAWDTAASPSTSEEPQP